MMSVAKGTLRPITTALQLIVNARPVLDDDGNAMAWILTRRERAKLLEILDEQEDARTGRLEPTQRPGYRPNKSKANKPATKSTAPR